MTDPRTDPRSEARTRHRRPKPAASPCIMVIFGAGGDLTRRLVMPALYNLARSGTLPANFALLGVGLGSGGLDGWRESLRASVEANLATDRAALDPALWGRLAASMRFLEGDFADPDLFSRLGRELDDIAEAAGTGGNVLFYLATPDRFFGPLVQSLGRAGLTREENGWRRVVIEKPFGHDAASARALDEQILAVLDERQIFRIDHFLGKETVQNILAFRFANGFFEPVWNRDRIDHVQITAAETLGVEHRGRFYEATGALRDMVPNHLFSLLSMVAMEPPAGVDPDAIRNRKAELFAAVLPVDPKDVVRGQYAAGAIAGHPVAPYRAEPDVAPASTAETYVALKLGIDNWRWAGVPFYLRTGKRLTRKITEIAIRFKEAPYSAFRSTRIGAMPANWLVLRIAPDERISLSFDVKRPGPEVELAPVTMDFTYDDWFADTQSVGYETLLYDVMTGDGTLFMRADMVDHGWRVVQPVLDAWASGGGEAPAPYRAGSEGPEAAERLIGAGSRRRWRPLD